PPPVPYYTYPLSLHDALPICARRTCAVHVPDARGRVEHPVWRAWPWPASDRHRNLRRCVSLRGTPRLVHHTRTARMGAGVVLPVDRKSTRLNSSHLGISYAVF